MLQVIWVEIPVRDIQRALTFYRALFELGEIEIADDGTRKTATLTGDAPLGVSLNQTANFMPSSSGTLVYFSAGSSITTLTDRAVAAGGTIITPKTSMFGDYYYALIQDTEGNVLAFSAHEPA